MPRVTNVNPTRHLHSFHEHAIKALNVDGDRLVRTALFAADCFLAPAALAESKTRGSTVAGIAISPFSTALGIATCVVAVPPLMAKIGIDAVAVKLSA